MDSHQQRGSKVQNLAVRIDIGDETVKIFGIYSFHRFSAKIREALSSWVKALGAQQLCQMSFFGPCKSYRLFRTNILSNISRSALLSSPRFARHFNPAISYNLLKLLLFPKKWLFNDWMNYFRWNASSEELQ